jgi:hypothetical protein
VGLANPVGRYWDRCFIALVETIPARPWLRTLALRTAAALRQPVEVTGRGGQALRVRVEVGVGLVHLDRKPAEVEDVLDLAQRLAEAARCLPSRTAMMDPVSGQIVAVESAQLAPARARAAAVAGLSVRRPAA